MGCIVRYTEELIPKLDNNIDAMIAAAHKQEK